MNLKGKRIAILAENLYQEMELWVPYYRTATRSRLMSRPTP